MPTRKLQNPEDFQGQKSFIGIDVHKKSWAVTVRSLNFVVAHFTQPPSPEALLSHIQCKFPGGEYYSTYEAGFSGTSAHEELCKLGIKNIVVHPGDIPRTDKEKKNKTDVHDSRSLAFNLEKGNLHSIYVMSRQQQEFRALFRLRESKARDVVRAINQLKACYVPVSENDNAGGGGGTGDNNDGTCGLFCDTWCPIPVSHRGNETYQIIEAHLINSMALCW